MIRFDSLDPAVVTDEFSASRGLKVQTTMIGGSAWLT
jgi:hypothetical protein